MGGGGGGWGGEQQRLFPFVVQRLRRHMQSMTDHQRCGRWEAYAVDGSEFVCPRSEENQRAMGEVGKPNGMPLVSLTTLYHLRLGLPWALRVGPGTDSERSHLRDMVGELPSGSLLVADAGFVDTTYAAVCWLKNSTFCCAWAEIFICSTNWDTIAKSTDEPSICGPWIGKKRISRPWNSA